MNMKNHFDANNVLVRFSKKDDIPSMVALSYQKRRAYEKVQPKFWRYAGTHAEVLQAKWFEERLNDDKSILLTSMHKEKIIGFIVGQLILSPEVYNPGGLTLMVDDFCVDQEIDWLSVGKKLINEIRRQAKERDAEQIIVVCGHHDQAKARFLEEVGLTIVSNWYHGEIT